MVSQLAHSQAVRQVLLLLPLKPSMWLESSLVADHPYLTSCLPGVGQMQNRGEFQLYRIDSVTHRIVTVTARTALSLNLVGSKTFLFWLLLLLIFNVWLGSSGETSELKTVEGLPSPPKSRQFWRRIVPRDWANENSVVSRR